jgi:hypothetical protein
LISMMSTLRCIDMKAKIPKRMCSTMSARHLAQVCRLAMVLFINILHVVISPLLRINFRIRYTLLLVETYMSYSIVYY